MRIVAPASRANFITERLIEVAARRFGFDPVELRRKNAVVDFPYDTAKDSLSTVAVSVRISTMSCVLLTGTGFPRVGFLQKRPVAPRARYFLLS